MHSEGFDFLFSGEVLGQRPMSQNRNALLAVARLSGFPEQVLRPLSARLLPISPMEESGLVDRERLFDFQGRSRKRQQALAREWNYPDFAESGGGCLLTEEGFSNQLRDLLVHDPATSVQDVELLKAGRQFRLSPSAKLIVGRNQKDNESLETQVEAKHTLLRCEQVTGPLGVLCGITDEATLHQAAAVVAAYGKGKDQLSVTILCRTQGQQTTISVAPMAREESLKLQIC